MESKGECNPKKTKMSQTRFSTLFAIGQTY